MPEIDLHGSPFDDETLVKLDIYRQYLRSWLPVFPQSGASRIKVCDYFAGPGHDSENLSGSPIIALEEIDHHRKAFVTKACQVQLRLNEFDFDKFRNLNSVIPQKTLEHGLSSIVNVDYFNEDFSDIVDSELITLNAHKHPNLIFLDQNGVKHVTPDVFRSFCALNRTDLMFFVSSSFFKRFVDHESYRKYHPDMPKDLIRDTPQEHTHRIVKEYYQSLLPADSKTLVYSFSIKHKQNIYGLIFCTNHILGADKFLKVAWDKNKVNGEADFDIDNDAGAGQLDLFIGKRLTKIEEFEQRYESWLLKDETFDNKSAFEFCLTNGMLPKHGKTVIEKLLKDGIITGPKRFSFNYRSIYREKKSVSFKKA